MAYENKNTVQKLETAPQLGALAALPGDSGLIPSAHMAAHNHLLIPVPGDLTPTSGHPRYKTCHVVHIHIGKYPDTGQKIKIN